MTEPGSSRTPHGGTAAEPGSRSPGLWAARPPLVVLRRLRSTPRGLTEDDAQARLAQHGDNAITFAAPPHWARQLVRAARNPFVVVLMCLAAASAVAGRSYSVAVISVLVAVSCWLQVWAERRSGRAAAALRALVASTATVVRRVSADAAPVAREVPVDQLVPGDIVTLAPGDMVPADIYLLRATDLMVSQTALTGESGPAGKRAPPGLSESTAPGAEGGAGAGAGPAGSPVLDCPWLCLAGGTVAGGNGMGVVVATGPQTCFGASYRDEPERPETCFERGIRKVTWALIRFLVVSIGLVAVVTAITRGNAAVAFLFVVSIAVGLTPEMLPVVVNAALARGARIMASLGVIVKRLPAIHNIGAMDVLCTDKTGTLTEGAVSVEFAIDPLGRPDPAVLQLACLNSYWSADAADGAIWDPLDEALLKAAAGNGMPVTADHTAVAVLPFDHARRRVTVVLRGGGLATARMMITKGAPAEVLACCGQVQAPDGGVLPLGARLRARLTRLADAHAAAGTRLLAVAHAEVTPRGGGYRTADEAELTLAGFVGFCDQPKDSAPGALRELAASGVTVKMITGDHPLVAARACRQAGIDPGEALLGSQVDTLADGALAAAAAGTVLFARIRPEQKARIVRALRASGHTVGYLGDGANDVLPLRAADVGISVESAVDTARESADVILARKDLTALNDAVRQGRRAFGNIIKYTKITVSSNAGNVGSMLAATAFLPFLPMLPLQILVQNLCFDFTQLTLAFDGVAATSLNRPRTFDHRDIARFVTCFGLVNTLADLATFAILWRLGSFHEGALGRQVFRGAWFTENLLTQALAVQVLRARAGISWWPRASRRTGGSWRDRAAWPVLAGTFLAAAVGLLLPLSPLAAAIGMHAPPLAYFPPLAAVLGGYWIALIAVRAVYVKFSEHWL